MSRFNAIQRAALLQTVRASVAEDPTLCRDVFDAVTEGVRDYAANQTDIGSGACCRLLSVLEKVDPETPGLFGQYFTAEQVMTCLERFFGGTKAMIDLRAKFKCYKPETKEAANAEEERTDR